MLLILMDLDHPVGQLRSRHHLVRLAEPPLELKLHRLQVHLVLRAELRLRSKRRHLVQLDQLAVRLQPISKQLLMVQLVRLVVRHPPSRLRLLALLGDLPPLSNRPHDRLRPPTKLLLASHLHSRMHQTKSLRTGTSSKRNI